MEEKNLKKKNGLVIYQAKNGAIEFRGDFSNETIWANQSQVAELFGVERSVITKHINNIFKDGEITPKSNVQKMHVANSDKPVSYYSLDVILSVGYRTNSKIAIEFRKWATKVLREHITKGFTINRKQIQKNYKEFIKTIENIKNVLPEDINLDPKSILELVKEFSSTWVTLDKYDKENLRIIGKTKKQIKLTGIELRESIQEFKSELSKKNELSDIFAQERERGSIEGIVGNVMQAFGGKDLYKTIEEKASHLLYFMVKNHPFVDGNKRCGAFSFIWFLRKTKVKGLKNINPSALTTITLLIAESKPDKKDQMINLITSLLEMNKN